MRLSRSKLLNDLGGAHSSTGGWIVGENDHAYFSLLNSCRNGGDRCRPNPQSLQTLTAGKPRTETSSYNLSAPDPIIWSGSCPAGTSRRLEQCTVTTTRRGTRFTRQPRRSNLNGSGFSRGGQLGYNLQSANWVLGVRRVLSWTGINPSGLESVFSANNAPLKYQTIGLATVSGRVGYAWTCCSGNGKGGAPGETTKSRGTNPVAGVNADRQPIRKSAGCRNRLEYGFSPNWTAFVEYDYIGVGNQTIR